MYISFGSYLFYAHTQITWSLNKSLKTQSILAHDELLLFKSVGKYKRGPYGFRWLFDLKLELKK